MKEYNFLKDKLFFQVNVDYLKSKQFILGATITKEQYVFANNQIQAEYCLNLWLGLIGLYFGVRGKKT